MSAGSLIGQIIGCVVVFMAFRLAKAWAYFPLIRIASMVLCLVSTIQTIMIGVTVKKMMKKEE